MEYKRVPEIENISCKGCCFKGIDSAVCRGSKCFRERTIFIEIKEEKKVMPKVKNPLCVVSNLPLEMKRQMVQSAFKGGQFVSVEWITKSGKISSMNCRGGVVKHLKHGKKGKNGSANTTAHIPQYLTVYKTNQGYRNLNMDTVLMLKFKGNVINFSD